MKQLTYGRVKPLLVEYQIKISQICNSVGVFSGCCSGNTQMAVLSVFLRHVGI